MKLHHSLGKSGEEAQIDNFLRSVIKRIVTIFDFALKLEQVPECQNQSDFLFLYPLQREDSNRSSQNIFSVSCFSLHLQALVIICLTKTFSFI